MSKNLKNYPITLGAAKQLLVPFYAQTIWSRSAEFSLFSGRGNPLLTLLVRYVCPNTECEVSERTSCSVSSSAPGQFWSLMVSGKGCRLTFKIRSRGASYLHCCYHRLCADLLHLGPQPLGRRRVFMKLARPWLLATGVFFPALSILTSPSVRTLCVNRQKELTSTEHLLCAWCC